MALRGTKIEATILVRPKGTVEDAILWAVRKRGLPPLAPATPSGPFSPSIIGVAQTLGLR
jgi:hypothetical protein